MKSVALSLIVAVSVAVFSTITSADNQLCANNGQSCASLTGIDLRLQANAIEHHTDSYESSAKVLIVRRAQQFNVTLGHQGFDPKFFQLRALVTFGKRHDIRRGHVIPLGADFESSEKWAGRVVEVTANTVVVQIKPPVTAAVAEHSLRFDIHAKGVEQTASIEARDVFYVLFNPWSEFDPVFLPDANMRGEYLLSDVGVVYQGWNGKRWIYGQFVEVVLEAVMMLMEQSGLSEADRGDIVKVSRMVSWLVNANDGKGVVAGRWQEPYDDGRKPWEWSSSVQILKQYYETGRAVAYGQCWVFASVSTTVARALGIPARPVTNIGSAHDTDDSLTIDKFLDKDMNEIERSGDSTWNFHVWTETWFSRSDINSVYSGWQVIDATPQERSDGLMQAGPGSVVAVQRGDVQHHYDLHFIWSEVSSLTVVWTPDPKVPLGWRKTKMTTKETGIAVLTKAIGRVNGYSAQDAEQITNQYKHADENERRDALANAYKKAGVELLFEDGELGAHEVECELHKVEPVMIGDTFKVILTATNKADRPLKVHAMLKVNSNYYNGIRANEIGKQTWTANLAAGQSTKFEVTVSPDIYLSKLVEHSLIKLFGAITVDETDQIWTNDQDVQLNKPSLQVTAMSEAHIGKPIKLRVQFKNPLNIPLTQCKLTAEGYTRYSEYDVENIAAGGQLDTEITVYVDRANYREKVIYFRSDQLQDVWGTVNLNIVG